MWTPSKKMLLHNPNTTWKPPPLSNHRPPSTQPTNVTRPHHNNIRSPPSFKTSSSISKIPHIQTSSSTETYGASFHAQTPQIRSCYEKTMSCPYNVTFGEWILCCDLHDGYKKIFLIPMICSQLCQTSIATLHHSDDFSWPLWPSFETHSSG